VAEEREVLVNRQSPRWALMEGFQVAKNGSPYLDRLRLIQTPLFGVYLHRIHRPDADRDPHDHPWWFASLVLSGGYHELVWDHPENIGRLPYGEDTTLRERNRWSLRTIRRSHAHKITAVRGQLWTLVLTGPRRSSWGFWTDRGFADWRDYLKVQDEDVALWGGGAS
jgi:hypothetical protein